MTAHPWPKRCGCGAVWSREAWSTLPFLAHWRIEGGPTHELRHCRCSTTLAVDVSALADVPAPVSAHSPDSSHSPRSQ